MIANVRPSGEHLFEDLHRAGGVPAVLHELAPLLHGDALTVTGEHARRASYAGAEALDRDVIAPLDDAARRRGRARGPARQPRARAAR